MIQFRLEAGCLTDARESSLEGIPETDYLDLSSLCCNASLNLNDIKSPDRHVSVDKDAHDQLRQCLVPKLRKRLQVE